MIVHVFLTVYPPLFLSYKASRTKRVAGARKPRVLGHNGRVVPYSAASASGRDLLATNDDLFKKYGDAEYMLHCKEIVPVAGRSRCVHVGLADCERRERCTGSDCRVEHSFLIEPSAFLSVPGSHMWQRPHPH